MIETPIKKYNVIYIFSRDIYPGILKIGKTSVEAHNLSDITHEMMVDAYRKRYHSAATLGVNDMHLQHVEIGNFCGLIGGSEDNFDDQEVFKILENSHYERVIMATEFGDGAEWFKVDLDHAKRAIEAVKKGECYIENDAVEEFVRPNIVLRYEQTKAIEETIHHYAFGNKMLWNAKMRFGKTLCALDVVRQQGYKKTLILTHRPTVRNGWYEDFHNLEFVNYLYGSKDGSDSNLCNAWVEIHNGVRENKFDTKGKDFETLYNGSAPYIYFASMQDLRGSKYIFGTEETNKKGEQRGFDKNDKVFENDWDLIILDEAHEGTQTDLGKRVVGKLTEGKNPKLLYLSGTPYNILSQFDEMTEVYTWDYVMEQEAKNNWDYSKGKNPYRGLAKMHIYTYDLNEVYEQNHEVYTQDDFFSFSEFFRVWVGDEKKDGAKIPEGSVVGDFVHKDDVRNFLDLLCNDKIQSYYPYSSKELRQVLKHTFWLVPGVKQAAALETMINSHRLHTEFGFQVINVAGDGKSLAEVQSNNDFGAEENKELKKAEKGEKDALAKVKKGIAANDKTITLSCGRLTTGVSIPEWTGVFMLAGGYKTGAAAYMQTIFRGQTPLKNGDVKLDCYAFDFAPDRTLTVVDEYIKMQPANKTKRQNFNNPLPDQNHATEESNASTESTLRHMSVIAMKGGQEIEYNALNFVQDVNRAYTDYFREHGLRGRKLTRDFATFSPDDHKLLAEIGKLFDGGKVTFGADGTLVMADNGETGEGSTKPAKSKKKDGTKSIKTVNTPPATPKKQDEQELRRKSQSVLDQIYVRLPLLIFGAVEDANSVTIDQLLSEEVIDSESWAEFMPEKFTKAVFKQIAHLIKVDALIAYAADIVTEAKAADELPVEERILTIAKIIARFHFPDNETVLTPWRVVNMHMTDTIGGYNFYTDDYKSLNAKPILRETSITKQIYGTNDVRLLEINSKSGVYPLWLSYSLFRFRCEREGCINEDQKKKIWSEILKNNIFVLCKSMMAAKITHRALAGYLPYKTRCRFEPNLVIQLKDNQRKDRLVKNIQLFKYWETDMKENKPLKFTAVVGNPPYQEESDNNKRNLPLYHYFVNASMSLDVPYVSLITPARWYTGSILLGDFTHKMLTNSHISKLVDFPRASDCFPSVEIKGGVSYFLVDNSWNGDCEITTIHKGQRDCMSRPLKAPYGDFFIRSNKALSIIEKVNTDEHTRFSNIVSSQNPFGFNSKVVGSPTKEEGDVIILSKFRTIGYIKRDTITLRKDWVDKWKVMTPIAGEGSALPNKVTGKPFVSKPLECCNGTYMVIGPFSNQQEAEYAQGYLKTKFVRFLISTIQLTQNTKSDSYTLVPLQDFSEPWTDEKLYAKYGITPEEQQYIESLIKPME